MDEPEDRPGIRALEAMKNLNQTVSIFKIPKIPQKKEDKMKILTEERYIEVWRSDDCNEKFYIFLNVCLCTIAGTRQNYSKGLLPRLGKA